MHGPRGRSGRRILAALSLAATVGVLAALPAAGSLGATARSSTATGGLTATEQAALEIVSVDVLGDEPAGIVVTVTFAGNIQKALGRGHLKQAAVAMILMPESADAAPAALVTQGAGAVGQTLRKTRSTEAGVVRAGKQLTFFIHGAGAGAVAEIVVKTFVRRPGAGSTREVEALLAGEPRTMSESELNAYVNGTAATFKTVQDVAAKIDALDCAALRKLKTRVDELLATEERWRRKLEAAKQDIASEIRVVQGQIKTEELYPAPIKGPITSALALLGLDAGVKTLREYLTVLKGAQRAAAQASARNEYLLEVVGSLDDDIANEIVARCEVPSFTARISSAGYDHTTPGSPPGQLPSTVCADFIANVPGARRWQAELSGPRSANADGFLSEGGEGRVVFGIPEAGVYHVKITVSAGTDQTAVVETDITVPEPPPAGKSKDCGAPPSPR